MTESVKAKYHKHIATVHAQIAQLPWENKEFYATWLAQTYYFVRHSTRLLALASGHANFEQNRLHQRMAKHIGEENAHEKIAQADLKAMGFNVSQMAELPVTKIFYRNQYFGIERMNSAYLLGYILYLEGLALAAGSIINDAAQKAFGGNAANFIRVHVEEDPDHVEKALKQLEEMNAMELAAVDESLDITAELYVQILAQSLAASKDLSSPRSADLSM